MKKKTQEIVLDAILNESQTESCATGLLDQVIAATPKPKSKGGAKRRRKVKEKFKVVIKRKEWCEGGLVVQAGKNPQRCVWGHVLHAAGVPDNSLMDYTSPSVTHLARHDIDNDILKSAIRKRQFVNKTIEINDFGELDWDSNGNFNEMSEKEKEQALVKEFAKHDIELEFVGRRA